MSRQAAQLLAAFEALSEGEKRAFTAEFVLRSVAYDSGLLEEEEIARAADQLFAYLEAEENDAPSR